MSSDHTLTYCAGAYNGTGDWEEECSNSITITSKFTPETYSKEWVIEKSFPVYE